MTNTFKTAARITSYKPKVTQQQRVDAILAVCEYNGNVAKSYPSYYATNAWKLAYSDAHADWRSAAYRAYLDSRKQGA